MWTATKHGWFSVVQHNEDEDLLMVRARNPEHLRKLAGELGISPEEVLTEPEEGRRWDYAARMTVTRSDWADYLVSQVGDITATSHAKEAMAGDDNDYYQFLLGVWAVGNKYQTTATGRQAMYDYEPAEVPAIRLRLASESWRDDGEEWEGPF